jgi:hypothetical protein
LRVSENQVIFSPSRPCFWRSQKDDTCTLESFADD